MSAKIATKPSPPVPTGPDANLIASLHALRGLGRFQDAAALVHEADASARRMTPHGHAAAGPALVAVSEYAAAEVHLLLATVEPALAPTALGQIAEVAWITHDQARGRAFALAGLALDPSHRNCRIQLQRNETEPSSGGVRAHAAVFADPPGNAGDRVLADAVQRAFASPTAAGDWHEVHIHQLFDERRLAEVNATEGLIVGGGELFRPDLAPNGNSGWQWNITDDVLVRIAVPLVVFAVGGNRFENRTSAGEDGTERRFTRSLRTLLEHSLFVGLRDRESVDRVRELLPGRLADRVGWQPCPTTITDLLPDPAQASASAAPGNVLLNCGYDQADRQFGDDYGTFLSQLHDWVVDTRERIDVHFVAHRRDDERFVGNLRREYGLTLPVIAMYDLAPAQIREHYRRARLVVGMRPHAGMIPFGCGTPIIGLISDPELAGFLADIDRPEWGIEVQDPQLAGRLGELTTELLDNGPAVAADIATIRRRLAEVTARNLSSLPASLHPTQRLGQDEASE